MATRSEIRALAETFIAEAEHAADAIQLSARARYEKRASAGIIGDDDRYAKLKTFTGKKAWSVVQSVDLRKSSLRAVQLGPRKTYITMHAYLPLMAKLVADDGGLIIGLRGDGLIAAFGLADWIDSQQRYDIDEKGIGRAVKSACSCGKRMIETTEEILDPLLKEKGLAHPKWRLMVGVGIDLGEIVITRIGIERAQDVTAYGPAVNNACKLSNKNGEIWITKQANDAFPTSEGGKLQMHLYSGNYRVEYPSGMKMLS